MFWITFKRIVRAGFTDFWRNGVVSLSAVLVMMITLMIFSGVIFSSALLKHTLVSLENKIDININLVPEVSEQNIQKIYNDIKSLPQVESVELLSRQQVLDNFILNNQEGQTIVSAIELLDDNPFGASLKIKAIDLNQYDAINTFIVDNYAVGTNNSMIEDVNTSQKQLIIERLKDIISAGNKFGFIVTVLFIILSILITLNTIRLAMYISRDEIKVMNLVGAEHSYITGPFIVVGAIYGLVSSILVTILLFPITYYIGADTARLFFDMNLFNYYISNFGQIFLMVFASGIFVGSVSSFLAIKRYLQNK